MKKLLLVAVLALLSLSVADTFADKPQPMADDQAASMASLTQTLQTRLGLHIDSIAPSQWPFFYEVVSDGELFYVDKTGDYLFYGKVMDTKTHVSLTDERLKVINHVDFNSLPLDLAVKQVKGDGSRKLVVFADPHCPFCSRFVRTLQDVDNITVYTFLFPLEGLHPGSTERSKQIWCAKDRLSAWNDWMLNQKDTPATACNTDQMNTVKQLGDKLRINGTPTLIFEDGDRVPGAIGKDDLEKAFKSLNKSPDKKS